MSQIEREIEQHILDGHIPFTLGLQNYGHTCYINSIIHCLQNLKSIVTTVRSTPFSIEMLNDRNRRKILPFLNSVIKLVSANYRLDQVDVMEQSDLKKFRESQLIRILEYTFTYGFRRNQQHDAYLFLMCLVHWLRDEMRMCNNLLSELTQSVNYNEIRLATETLTELFANMDIKFQQTIMCPHGCRTFRKEYRNILTIRLHDSSQPKRFFENMNESIKYHFEDTYFPQCSCSNSPYLCKAFKCEICKQHVPARKVLKISKLPELVIIKMDLGGFDEINQVSRFFTEKQTHFWVSIYLFCF